MARKARVVATGVPHHVTQRGNDRQNVFLSDDRRCYLTVLCERSRQAGLSLLGYCLMTNHAHLVAVPEQTRSLAQASGGPIPPTPNASTAAINAVDICGRTVFARVRWALRIYIRRWRTWI